MTTSVTTTNVLFFLGGVLSILSMQRLSKKTTIDDPPPPPPPPPDNNKADSESTDSDDNNKLQQSKKTPKRQRYMWENIIHRGSRNNSSDSLKSLADEKKGNTLLWESAQLTKLVDIGDIFGMDVGGSLSKLIYFERMDYPSDSKKADFGDSPHETRSRSNSNVSDGTRVEEDEKIAIGRARSNSVSDKDKKINKHLLRQRNASMPLDSGEHGTKTNSGFCIATDPPSLDDNSPSPVTSATRNALSKFYNFVNTKDAFGQTGRKDEKLTFFSRKLGGEFGFIRFETRFMEEAVGVIRSEGLHQDIARMGCTGGGAHKYQDLWEKELGITIGKQGEMDCLVAGLQFALAGVVGECYTFKPPRKENDESDSGRTTPEEKPTSKSSEFWSRKVQRDTIETEKSYPYLLVSIGTGVSVIRVDGPGEFERISGSTIGGGTYWGLCRLLTDVESFDTILDLADKGDADKVDMMVGDIYGKDSSALEKLNLPSSVVASSFGKLVSKTEVAAGVEQQDLAKALLMMITNNIAQVAYLNAQLHSTHRIYFVGNFLRHNNISMQRLAYSIDFWSKGEMEALFLEHEGYFGALGAFLREQGVTGGRRRDARRRSQSDVVGGGGGGGGGGRKGGGGGGHGLSDNGAISGSGSKLGNVAKTRSGSGPSFDSKRRFSTFK